MVHLARRHPGSGRVGGARRLHLRAHSRAGNETGGSLYLGHPKFEGFEVLITERAKSPA